MYWRDLSPPHFHAKYQDQEITVEVESGTVHGRMGRKAIALIQEWRLLHQDELMEDWEHASHKRALHCIDPLE
jgi:hypothetical protein